MRLISYRTIRMLNFKGTYNNKKLFFLNIQQSRFDLKIHNLVTYICCIPLNLGTLTSESEVATGTSPPQILSLELQGVTALSDRVYSTYTYPSCFRGRRHKSLSSEIPLGCGAEVRLGSRWIHLSVNLCSVKTGGYR